MQIFRGRNRDSYRLETVESGYSGWKRLGLYTATAGILLTGVVCGSDSEPATPGYEVVPDEHVATAPAEIEPTAEATLEPYTGPPLTPEQEGYMKIIEDRYEIVKDFFEGAGIEVPEDIRSYISFEGDDVIKIGFKPVKINLFDNSLNYHDNVTHAEVHNVIEGGFGLDDIIFTLPQPYTELFPLYFGEMGLEKGVNPKDFKFSESDGINSKWIRGEYEKLKLGQSIDWSDVHVPGWIMITGLELDYGADYESMQELSVALKDIYDDRIDKGETIFEVRLTPKEIQFAAENVFGSEVSRLFEFLEPGLKLYRTN